MEVLPNLKKNVANVIIRRYSLKRLAKAGCSLCGLWVYSLATKFPQVAQRQPASCKYNPLLPGIGATLKRQTTMRKYVFLALLLATTSVAAQSRNIEPEKAGQMVVVNSDSTVTLLQKEEVKMKAKSTSWGMIPIPGSSLLDKSKALMVIKGTTSKTKVPAGELTLILKVKNINEKAQEAISVCKFEKEKKNRTRIMGEFAILKGMEANASLNDVSRTVEQYGSDCYKITIPQIEPGEYAVFFDDATHFYTFTVE
jgi:hypothetical protein